MHSLPSFFVTPPSLPDFDEDFDDADPSAGEKRPLEATSSRGTRISVVARADPQGNSSLYMLALYRGDGNRITLSFTGDIRIGEPEDGTLLLYNSRMGKTRIYTTDGRVSEIDGDAITADIVTALINTEQNSVATDGGLVFNFADGTYIQGGANDSHILLADGLRENHIHTTDGNTTIHGGSLSHSRITLGSGNNTVRLTIMEGGELCSGHGDNILGIYALTENARLTLGDGFNTICIYGLRADATVRAGNGTNIVDMDEIEGNASVYLGNGDNRIHFYQLGDNTDIRIGDGNNDIHIYEMEDAAAVRIGNGNSTLRICEMEDRSTVRVGDGCNSVQIEMLRQATLLHCGDGDNDIRIRNMRDNAKLAAGYGGNTVQAGRLRDRSAVSLGSGDNFCIAGQLAPTAVFQLEAGKLHDLKANKTLRVAPELIVTLARRNSRRIQAGLPTSIGTLEAPHFPYDLPPRWRSSAMAGTLEEHAAPVGNESPEEQKK